MFNNNRKKKGSPGSFPLHTALFLAVGATLALGYVWIEMRGEALGERIRRLEGEQQEIQRRYDNEVWKWERMTSPLNIEEALRRNNIEMVWPDEMSVVRLRKTDTAAASLQNLAMQVAQFAQSGKPSAHD